MGKVKKSFPTTCVWYRTPTTSAPPCSWKKNMAPPSHHLAFRVFFIFSFHQWLTDFFCLCNLCCVFLTVIQFLRNKIKLTGSDPWTCNKRYSCLCIQEFSIEGNKYCQEHFYLYICTLFKCQGWFTCLKKSKANSQTRLCVAKMLDYAGGIVNITSPRLVLQPIWLRLVSI